MVQKILIIDDEQELVEMVKIRLEANNYEVITAPDGQKGLAKAKKENPDLILLDIMLPVMDGYKVCSLLKTDRWHKEIPILMFTVRAQESDKKMGEELGADAYITKPFESQILLEKIRKLLGG